MSFQQSKRPKHWQFSCRICLSDHPIRKCEKFLNCTPTERYELIVIKKYCINCFALYHKLEECRSSIGCHICQKRHNTLLHDASWLKGPSKQNENDALEPSEQKKNNPQTSKRSSITDSIHGPPSKNFNWNLVFIPTASIKISGENLDTWIATRAIINSSLTISRISQSFVQKYRIKTINEYSNDFAFFEMRSYNDKNKWWSKVTALITKELPRRPYSGPINVDPTEDFPANSLADIDPQSNTSAEIELGSDVYLALRRDGVIQTEIGQVVAEKSALGYLFSGPVQDLW